MTGAIDQMGNVQAVGGLNQKIEGFFRVGTRKTSPGKPWCAYTIAKR